MLLTARYSFREFSQGLVEIPRVSLPIIGILGSFDSARCASLRMTLLSVFARQTFLYNPSGRNPVFTGIRSRQYT